MKKMLSFNGLPVLCALFLFLLLIQPVASQDSLSPTFSRRAIEDDGDDLKAINCGSSPRHLRTLPDIRAASFSSDGKTLSATLWLSRSVDEIPTIYLPRYMMILDIDPAGDITALREGRLGDGRDVLDHLDYQVVFTPGDNSTWERQIHELSSTEDLRSVNITRLKQIDVVDSSGEHYIKMSLDLGLINNPKTYSLLFYEDFRTVLDEKCIIADLISPPAYVPAPGYDLTVSPRSIVVRPGETKYAELIINSSLQLKHTVSLSAPEKPDYVSIEFEPHKQDILPNDLGISRIKVNVSSDASVTDVINAIPIEATISFPVRVAQPPADQSRDNTKQQEQGLKELEEALGNTTKQREQGLNNTTEQQEQGLKKLVKALGNTTKRQGHIAGGMNNMSSTSKEIAVNDTFNNGTNQSLSRSSSSTMRQELLTTLGSTSNNNTNQTVSPSGNSTSPPQKLSDSALSNNNPKQPMSTQRLIRSTGALSPEAVQSMINDAVVNLGTVTQRLDKQTTLYVSVLPSITPQEHFVNFWTVWGSLVGLVAGSFIAGLAGLIFKRRGRSPPEESES